MTNRICAGALFLLLFISPLSCTSSNPGGSSLSGDRLTQSFDSDWRFNKGDQARAQEIGFNDSSWRTLDVPHDWAIEGPIDKANTPGKSGGFFPDGIGWYRKTFTIADADANHRFFIDFDGIMANSDVWINGYPLGHRPYGYVSFQYDLTGHLNHGKQPNVLAVRCDDSLQPSSRWYSGAGIYRHVRLVAVQDVHLDSHGPYITTPKIADSDATVHVQSTVVNQSDSPRQVRVQVTIFDNTDHAIASGESPAQSISAGQSADLQADIDVKNPKPWDLEQPNLYRAVTHVLADGQPVDGAATTFGIRECHFDAATGFWLNGRNIKIYGCALHADGGAVGMAVPLGVWQRRLTLLKDVGCNAIRTAHNPPSPEFLDLCDRMGFLVMDEMFDVWTVGKTPLLSRTVLNDYHLYYKEWWQRDVTDTVCRDRNHPSVIIWSAGNEIHDINPNNDLGFRIFRPLRDLYHQLDPTRPVTLAVVRPNGSHVYDNGFADLMDVVGQNYRENELLAAHQAKPTRKILGTENHHDLQTWLALRDHPEMSGQFLWTGVDYLGESSGWPQIGHESGLFDRTLRARPSAYQRRSWWTADPVVAIARVLPPAPRAAGPRPEPGMDAPPPPRARYVSDWTSHDAVGHLENVEVYTNCQQVELFLNNRSLGVEKRHADDSPLTWKLPYEPGVLKAVGSIDGRPAATHELATAGVPAKIELSSDQDKLSPVWDDVDFVRATVTDAAGVTVPDADDLIQFQIFGPGQIVAVDNGDTSSHEPFQASQRHAYKGRCIAILRATGGVGRITLRASAPGLSGSSVDIRAVPPAGEN